MVPALMPGFMKRRSNSMMYEISGAGFTCSAQSAKVKSFSHSLQGSIGLCPVDILRQIGHNISTVQYV